MTEAECNALLSEITDLHAFLGRALDGLKEGTLIGIEGFDQRIARLCDTIGQAAKEEKQTFLPELISLLNLVHKYDVALREISQGDRP